VILSDRRADPPLQAGKPVALSQVYGVVVEVALDPAGRPPRTTKSESGKPTSMDRRALDRAFRGICEMDRIRVRPGVVLIASRPSDGPSRVPRTIDASRRPRRLSGTSSTADPRRLRVGAAEGGPAAPPCSCLPDLRGISRVTSRRTGGTRTV